MAVTSRRMPLTCPRINAKPEFDVEVVDVNQRPHTLPRSVGHKSVFLVSLVEYRVCMFFSLIKIVLLLVFPHSSNYLFLLIILCNTLFLVKGYPYIGDIYLTSTFD